MLRGPARVIRLFAFVNQLQRGSVLERTTSVFRRFSRQTCQLHEAVQYSTRHSHKIFPPLFGMIKIPTPDPHSMRHKRQPCELRRLQRALPPSCACGWRGNVDNFYNSNHSISDSPEYRKQHGRHRCCQLASKMPSPTAVISGLKRPRIFQHTPRRLQHFVPHCPRITRISVHQRPKKLSAVECNGGFHV